MVKWRVPATAPFERVAAVIAAQNNGKVVASKGGTTIVAEKLTISRRKVEYALGRELTDEEWRNLFSAKDDTYEGGLAFSQELVEITSEDLQRGWHIVVDRETHDRWHAVATRLGMTKKAFTTMCIEYYIRSVLREKEATGPNGEAASGSEA